MPLVVLGVIVAVLGTFLLIGILAGDDTDEIDPQNGDSAPVLGCTDARRRWSSSEACNA